MLTLLKVIVFSIFKLSKYIIEYEIASFILLLSIISAIVLTYKKNPKNKYQNPTKQISVTKKDRLKVITGLKE